MTFITSAPQPVLAGGDSIQAYARLAGALGLASVLAGGFGEAYAPGAIFVAGDAAATAQRILAHESLFRWGFAAYLVEALCDATLTMLFWTLVRPVHRNLAMLMVVLRIISTCGFAGAEVLYFSALPMLKGTVAMAAIPSGTLNALAYNLVRTATFGESLFSAFYGFANVVMGWLMYRSGFIPRIFGVGMIVMGVAFAARTFLVILAPAIASGFLLLTAAIAFVPMAVWLLVKGVNESAWQRAMH